MSAATTFMGGFHGFACHERGVAASRQSAAGWLFRRTAALRRAAATGDGSWAAFIRFCACIGTMNQIGTPLPALSPQGGERVAEGRRGGGHGQGTPPKNGGASLRQS